VIALRRLLLFLSLPLTLLLLATLWLGWRLLLHENRDDPVRLENKRVYLESLVQVASLQSGTTEAGSTEADRPDIVFILFDDLGLGDLGFTQSSAVGPAHPIATPALDQLAANGVVLDTFYAPAAVCTPSRAGFLTGRNALRAGIPDVVFPTGSWKSLINILPGRPTRIPAEEILLPEMLQAAGYRTAMVGKWHLGDRSPSLPNELGFEHYYGALYSNDMEPFALYRNTEVAVEAPVDQTRLNRLYVDAALAAISETPAGQPLFLYFAHNFPHRPLYASPEQQGKSRAGLYGDVIEDLDRGVAAIVAALRRSGRFDNTLIVVSSDNGPWYQGSAAGTRGRKGESFEGGGRVPFLAHWPVRLPAGLRHRGMASGLDLLPTIADWLQLPLPQDRIIDGRSLRGLLAGETDSPHDYLFTVASDQVMAVRDSRFKYHGKRPVMYAPMPSSIGFSVPQGPWLIDLQADPLESWDASSHYPAEAASMEAVLGKRRQEMKENPRGWR